VLKRTDTSGLIRAIYLWRVFVGARSDSLRDKEITMLYTIAVILMIAWLLGIVGTYTIGAFVHVLLVVAIILFVVGLLGGRRVLG
jgi:asparagine N-glycosylation enzyme membrane subunit Stt3